LLENKGSWHAGPEQAQAAFAAQRIVGRQQDRSRGGEPPQEQAGQYATQVVERPGIVGEEAVEARPVTNTDLAGGEDTFGDIAVAARQRPAGEDQDEQAKAGGGEHGTKRL
jgi:hypothetical protein